MNLCRLCEKRRPRRYCPGLGGDICARCCGEEREVTVRCPLDCPHLIEARQFERLPEPDPAQFPHAEIELPEGFLREREELLWLLANLLLKAASRISGAVDADVAQALDAIIRTYRTLAAGLYYETRPDNLLAAAIQRGFNEGLAELERQASERGLSLRDKDVLGVLVFLRRTAFAESNGRPLGRRFLQFLQGLVLPPASHQARPAG
jgi:hypothetical protein